MATLEHLVPLAERARAAAWLEGHEKRGLHAVAMAVRSWRERQDEGLVAVLLERAVERRISDREACLVYAELAEKAARSLDGEHAGAIRARVLAELGNARRIHEKLREAAECFVRAEKVLEGAEDEVVAADLLGLKATLLIDYGRFTEAKTLGTAAAEAFRDLGFKREELHQLARLTQVLPAAGEYREAKETVVVALRQLTGSLWNTQLAVIVAANSVYTWVEEALECGDDEARRDELLGLALEGAMLVRPLFDQCATPFQRHALNWLCARLLYGQRRLDTAESLYRSLFEDYFALGHKLQAAFVGLDICMVLVRKRKLDEMKAWAASCAATFRGAELNAHLWAALRFLMSARDLEAAEQMIRRTFERCGTPGTGVPRGLPL